MTTETTTTTNPTPATDTTSAQRERYALLEIINGEIKRLLFLRHKIEKGVSADAPPQPKRKYKTRASTPITCAHPWRKHYGKGLCESCWSYDWRQAHAGQAAPATTTKTEGEAA
jgi:hypothetical protein